MPPRSAAVEAVGSAGGAGGQSPGSVSGAGAAPDMVGPLLFGPYGIDDLAGRSGNAAGIGVRRRSRHELMYGVESGENA
jgi:hypothetical protein